MSLPTDASSITTPEPLREDRLILVMGAAKSGMSLFTAMLAALGCHVPQPETGGGEGPFRGFGEPRWVSNLHARLLRDARVQSVDARPSAWAQAAAAARAPGIGRQIERWLANEFKRGNDHVVVKDPRLFWFVPAWRRAGETVAAPCFVTLLRHPLEVIQPKNAPDAGRWNTNAQTAGWINVMLFSERATRGDRRAIVRYEDLADDGMAAVANVAEELDLSFIERPIPEQMRVATDLRDPDRSERRATWESLEVGSPLAELAEEVAAVLEKAASSGQLDDSSVRTELDALRQRYVDLYSFAESTAQFSIAAGGAAGPTLAAPGSAANKGAQISQARLKKLVRKVSKKGKRTIYDVRNRRGSAPGGEEPPTASNAK